MNTTYYSDRMLLKPDQDRSAIQNYTREMGWPLVSREGDPAQQENFRAEFEVAPGSRFTYVEDFTSRQRYFYISSDTEFGASRLSTLTEDDLAPEEISALIRACDDARGLDRARETVRLGVAAPHVFSEEIFSRISSGMKDEDPRVRRLSMWATTYSHWPQYVPIIQEISESDPDEGLRERATQLLPLFEKYGS